jgi:hypothetical protein
MYTAAAVMATPRAAAKTGAYASMSELSSLKAFVAELAGRVAAEAAK